MTVTKRFLPIVFVLLGTMILLSLGTWQVQRLAWKNDLIAARDAGLRAPPIELPIVIEDGRQFDYRIVMLKGEFRHDLEQLFGAEARNGVLGYRVVTPFMRADGPMILVDRGWVPADKVEPSSRSDGLSKGLISLSGIARYRLDDRPGWFTPDNDPTTGHWYHYDLKAMEVALGIELASLVIEADMTTNPGGFPIGGGTKSALTNNHLQYAVTWYGLAAALIGVYIVFRRQQS